jgi:predicted esterase
MFLLNLSLFHMNVNIDYWQVKKTARVVSNGQVSGRTSYFWLALHGSHMICEQMLHKFRDFDPETHLVVAPEGLNRFYSKGFGGEVLATWMTSRDRLKEIEDFSDYLTELYQHYCGQLPEGCKKIVLGFSQGVTTAYRWLHSEKIELDLLLGYACWIPEDIDLKQSATNLALLRQVYTFGLQDQCLQEDRVEVLKEIIRKNDLDICFEPYTGGHRVDRKQLKFLLKKYGLKDL